MRLIKADHERRLQIPGVPEPVLRPVDIDKSKTGFETLRSLRIYRFDPGSVIDGHAEEDEVMIVLLAGSIELTLIEEGPNPGAQTFTLSAVGDQQKSPCAAYLPPLAAYRLVALSAADVAYARATPLEGPPLRVFYANHADANQPLWEELAYPRLLRIRVLQVTATSDVILTPVTESEDSYEALLHLTTEGIVTVTTSKSAPTQVESWDTVALGPAEHPALHVPNGSSARVLVVLAKPR
jgi:hypothetical protein